MLRVRGTGINSDTLAVEPYSRTIELWWDGERRRVDELCPHFLDPMPRSKYPPSERRDHYREVHCVNGEWSYRFIDGFFKTTMNAPPRQTIGEAVIERVRNSIETGKLRLRDDDGWYRPPAGMHRAKFVDPEFFNSRFPHPRSLGVAPWFASGAGNWDFDTFFGGSQRSDVSVRASDSDVSACYKLAYRLNGEDIVATISPKHGYSPVRWTAMFESGGIHYADTTTVSWKQVGPCSLWFPEKIVFERRENGEVTIMDEATIEVKSINEPINPAVFTPAGMGIAAGDRVLSQRSANPLDTEELVWGGSSLVTIAAWDAIVHRRAAARFAWIVAITCTVGVTLAALLWKRSRRPRLA